MNCTDASHHIQKDSPLTADLTDLQCLWYLQEEGDAYKRSGNLAMAWKRYQAVAKVSRYVRLLFLFGHLTLCSYQVFDDYEDDQYDFHTYCLRRMTLSAYIS